MKTFSPTPEHIDHQWFVVDADNQVLGRLAAQIAHRLRGKHKPEFAPHMDNGDVIVVVNCEKIKVTGAKLEKKKVDMICANNLKVSGAGFGVDTNILTVITRQGAEELPLMGKEDAAGQVLDRAMALLDKG